MPITHFLAGQSFDLEVIESMSAAFAAACGVLQLKVGKDDPATRFVAEKVIELAQRGVRSHDDAERIWFKRWKRVRLSDNYRNRDFDGFG